MKTVCTVVLASLFMAACQTTHPSGSSNLNYPFAQYRDLATAMRSFVGVQTSGTVGQEKILIMRNQKIGETEPLYVINGQPMGTSYQLVNQTIDMQRVTYIRVLRSPAEAIDYGPLSAGGVIEVYYR